MGRTALLEIRCLVFLFLISTGAVLARPVVTGTALGSDHRPVAGVRVELLAVPSRTGSPGPAEPVAVVTTDPAGRFALQAPSSGIWRVVVRSMRAAPLQSPPLPVVEPLELPPAQAGTWAPFQSAPPPQDPPAEPLVLSGQVVDATGRKPIPGALVWASADPGAFVRTDAEGRFQVMAPGRRRFDLEILAPGYLLKRVLITRPQLVSRKTGTLALARAGKLRGKVVDPQGRPLTGAAVVAVPQGALGERAFSPSDPVADQTVADPKGRFELLHVRPEQIYEIRASRAGAFPAAQRATVGDPAMQPRDLTLVLAPARSARGKVQDPAGRPIAGAEAVVRPALRPGSGYAADEMDTQPAQSDAQGVFSLPELPAAEVELSVRRKGYAAAVFPALRIPTGTGPADLGVVTLRPGAALTGRVLDHRGQAVPDGEIFLLSQPASPNEMERALKDRKPAGKVAVDGRFSIEDLAQAIPVHVVVRAPWIFDRPGPRGPASHGEAGRDPPGARGGPGGPDCRRIRRAGARSADRSELAGVLPRRTRPSGGRADPPQHASEWRGAFRTPGPPCWNGAGQRQRPGFRAPRWRRGSFALAGSRRRAPVGARTGGAAPGARHHRGRRAGAGGPRRRQRSRGVHQ